MSSVTPLTLDTVMNEVRRARKPWNMPNCFLCPKMRPITGPLAALNYTSCNGSTTFRRRFPIVTRRLPPLRSDCEDPGYLYQPKITTSPCSDEHDHVAGAKSKGHADSIDYSYNSMQATQSLLSTLQDYRGIMVLPWLLRMS